MKVPPEVGELSRRWDDEHLDLASAAETIGGASTTGFSEAVETHAARFTSAWERLAQDSGAECEARADGLRTTIADFLATDAAAAGDVVELSGYLEELR